MSYALLVSLRTPEVSTDLYTPIATQLGVPVEIASAVQNEIADGVPVQMELGW
ncbi:hypothetical protein [Streptomyces sp. NPDC088915]|uniref:hypothetical protein n=1 Tax=Streptomyces sp. NPDC088915 TaxID=3365912 RepID=UPI003829E6F3